MKDFLFILIPFLLVALGLCFQRQAEWHQSEAAYWKVMARWNLMDYDIFSLEEEIAVLAWAKENRPSFIEKLRPWKPPFVRMKEASR